jgi:mRNA interferase HigB
MRIISKKTIKEYYLRNAIAKQPLLSWYKQIASGTWDSPQDLKRDFPSLSIIANNRIVFNVKGNSYRLIARVNFDFQIIWIRFIGTHAEYDKIDATKI